MKKVSANFISETVTVDFDDSLTGVEEFTEALKKKGYRVDEVRYLD